MYLSSEWWIQNYAYKIRNEKINLDIRKNYESIIKKRSFHNSKRANTNYAINYVINNLDQLSDFAWNE